jgi:hypothetical protein
VSNSKVRKFTLAGLIALPLLAVVAVAFAFAWGQSSTEPTQAAVIDGGSMALDVSGDKTCADPADTAAGIICVPTGAQFDVDVNVTGLPDATGYLTVQSYVTHGALAYKGNAAGEDLAFAVNDCSSIAVDNGKPPAPAGTLSASCTDGTLIAPAPSLEKGTFLSHTLTCPGAPASLHTIDLLPIGDAVAGGNGAGFVATDGVTQIPASDQIQVRCQVAPTATFTSTPTNTNTPTATNTPVSQPPFVKSPSLQNLWLTRQGTKIPPVQCVGPQGGDDSADLSVDLGVPVAALDPKGSGKVVNVGAFEFEVNYDDNKVCVTIEPGQAAVNMTCFIEDAETKPTLEGVARIGCVTVGKKLNVDGIWNFHLSALGGALASDCVIAIQESPIGVPGVATAKGTMVATGPGEGANCVGSTPAFGWVVPVPPGVAPPLGFDNETGDLVAVIPCQPPELGVLCTANGSVVGNFFQEETTNELAFVGTFTIQGGPALNNLLIEGDITGARKSRFALNLATVSVHPQPDAYSTGKATQDNGNVVQILNKKCEIADDQGHPIAIFSCEDAEVTIRWLEGDVEPDCSVDTLDTQAIAFRWGSEKGSLIYNARFNLEPWGTQADDDIDIKDLQFVYGRFGSTCEEPHPDQPPVNAKQ